MNRIKGLILKYLRNEISGAERLELEAWLGQSPDNRLLFDELNNPEWVATALAKMDALHEEEIWDRVRTSAIAGRAAAEGTAPSASPREATSRQIGRHIGGYGAAAAAVIIIVAGATYWWQQSKQTPATPVAVVTHDVAPGSNKAILTLSNGQQIILDSAHNGALAQQGNAQVIKTDSGQIAYKAGLEKPAAMLYNTLTTPRGGQHELTLSDGTKVWLNAASAIRYPVFFTGSERRVEITGEVYFEVTKNASQPFKVLVTGNQEVDVLGTSFDINAYDDEPGIKTTLLTGSIKTEGVVLKPGQQSVWGVGQPVKVEKDADVEEAVAWKNGKFIFTGSDIYSVMRQLDRWYDVDAEYKGDFKGVELVGVISRFKNVSEILKMLEQTRTVRFQVQGKKIMVMPWTK